MIPALAKSTRAELFALAAVTAIILLCVPGMNGGAPPDSPWPAPVKDYKPPQSGEHPRLFFRKSDLAEIKKRAETPEGKVIVRRLRELLGGGEGMPTEYNPNRGKQADGSGGFEAKVPPGKTYTLWHAAGFGMLWQLTGDRKYAGLGRQCVEKALDGQRDRDNRYSFRDPTGALRAGPSLGAVAMAYDLCYDGWDEDFRKKVALEIQNYNQGQFMSLEELAKGARHNPGSNHWGCQIGGALLALLAIKNDPGVDAKKVDGLLEVAGKNIIRNLTEGFGDGGYFWEHAGPGGISSDTAFVPALQALKVAGGQDYISPRPNASMVTMIRVYELLRGKDGKPVYPLRHPSSYGTQDFGRVGLSRGGQFAQGFGAVKDEYRVALLWTHNHVLELDAARRSYDTLSPYPHRAVLALVNWPIGDAEKNPSEVLPRVLHDSIWHYFVFRNQWKDENDIVVTGLWGARQEKTGGPERVMVWGLGERLTWSTCPKVKQSSLSGVQADGSGVAAAGDTSLAVDFSKASGADALLVMVGPGAGAGKAPAGSKVKTFSVTAGKTAFAILVLSADGQLPEPKADGDKVVIGGQTVSYDGGKLVLAKTAAAPK